MIELKRRNNNSVWVTGLFNDVSGAFVNDRTPEMTLCYNSDGFRGTITGITSASPPVVTSAAHGLSNGDKVVLRAVIGIPEAWGVFTVANVTTNTFELSGETFTGAFEDTSASDDKPTWFLAVPDFVSEAMTYDADSNGDYYVVVPGTLDLRVRQQYKSWITDPDHAGQLDLWVTTIATDRT